MMATCTICGKEIKSNSKFCRSCSRKVFWSNPENKRKMIESLTLAQNRSDVREKRSNSLKGNKNGLGTRSAETRQRISESTRNSWLKDSTRLNHKIASEKCHSKRSNSCRVSCSSLECRLKSYNTKKQNHSFNTSKPETDVFTLLQQVFKDVQTQYMSKVYPFNCDFYISSIDLYIECHFHWTHGGRPFNENDKSCSDKLSQWKEKSKTSKFYQRAIKTWTDLDVRKKQIAEDNKLNYKVFYNYNTCASWLDSIKQEDA